MIVFDETAVFPFHGVEDFPPESAPLAVKSAQATSNGLIDPVMFGQTEHQRFFHASEGGGVQ